MNKRNGLLVLIIFVSVVAGLILGNFTARRSMNVQGFLSGGKFGKSTIDELLYRIDNDYVDTMNIDSLTQQTMADLVSKLDPHSVYIPADELADINSELESSFTGIGVQFNIQNDTVMVVAVVSGGPSEKMGVLAGDRIVQVNDSNFTGKKITNNMVMKKLKGKSGTKVKLGIRRNGTPGIIKYTITRGEIPVNSVDVAYMADKITGYIKVSKFAERTYAEFLNAIAKLKTKGAKKFIIDLRGNGGGFMEQAINMVNEFLPDDELIVYSEGRAYPRSESRSDGKGSCINAPLVVLIDESSASASEIFSGAIQDNDRGTIIGLRSFGKGLVQQQFPLTDGSAVRLTVARYYTPSGRCIQKPYVKGKAEDYAMDLINRLKHGEFDSKDSVHVPRSLKYKTLHGRTVYGGGGIMPDIFVPRDTSGYTPFFIKTMNYGYVYQYAFSFTDRNREKLKSFKNWQSLDNYLDSQHLLADFTAFVKRKGMNPVPQQVNLSSKILLTELKAFIIRNSFGDEGFYPVLNKDDKAIQKAMEVISKK